MVNIFKLLPLGDWLWIGASTALIAYHVVTLERTKIETRAEVNAQWTGKIAEINKQVQADHDAQQAQITTLAASSQPAIKAKIDSISAQINQLAAQAKAPPKVFASDCKLPRSEVEAYNAIR